MNSIENFKNSLNALEHAMEFEGKIKEDIFYFGGIAKAFETAIEYAWKYFRLEAIDSGLDVPSPRDAIKLAGSLKIIDDVEDWLDLLKTRNIAVHNYFGLSNDEYLKEIKRFILLAKKVNLK